ncbi:MAG TPA: ADP-ribosylglycohydrolase family protein [Acidobacteriota bacterium]|nr:ADP-ribosylglycohydrolase family protein [Acidobacteriota bacterium]
MNPNEVKNKCIGAIAGFAIGDALGMPAAFLSRDQIRQYYGKPISCFIKAHPGHASESLPQGSYTDNTQTMLATAECLIECKKMDPARHADALLSWFQNTVPHRTPAEANVKACRHLSTGRPWNKSGVFSNCCAAAMRMTPIGLFFNRSPETLTRAAIDNCLITHNEPQARAASVAVAYLIARLLQSNEDSSPGDQVLETADHIAHMDAEIAAVLRWSTQITHLPPEKALFEIGTSSDCSECIPAAVYCFLKYPKNFSGAVLSAANAGDAADSIAALAGSFVGALAGANAIDKPWLQEVENSDLLIGVGKNLAQLLSQPEMGPA